MNRKDFIVNSLLASGYASLKSSGVFGLSSQSQLRRVSLIGCNYSGALWVKAFLDQLPNAQLIACSDVFQQNINICLDQIHNLMGDSFKVNVPNDRRFAGLSGYKASIMASELLILNVAPALVPTYLKYAVENKKHVFITGAIVTDIHALKEIVQIAKEAKSLGLSIGVNLPSHFDDGLIQLKQNMDRGDYGHFVDATLYNYSQLKEDASPEFNKASTEILNYQDELRLLNGGALTADFYDQINLVLWLKEQNPVRALGGIDYLNEAAQFVHTAVQMNYSFRDRSSLQCLAYHKEGIEERELSLIRCSKAVIEYDKSQDYSVKVYSIQGELLDKYRHEDEHSPKDKLVEVMTTAMLNGARFSNIQEAIDSSLSCLLGVYAAENKMEIELSLLSQSDQKLFDYDAAFKPQAAPPVKSNDKKDS